MSNAESTGRLSRCLDVVVASVGLLLAMPLMLCIAALVYVFGGRPVIFTQTRLGRGRRPFSIHKFRTLVPDATDAGVAVVGDRRVTRIGGWLRRSRLDELPQLFDVLRGRMALVGPRPEIPADLVHVEPADLDRLLAVRPGITGPTQLAFVAEDECLARVPDPTATYREVLCQPRSRTTWPGCRDGRSGAICSRCCARRRRCSSCRSERRLDRGTSSSAS